MERSIDRLARYTIYAAGVLLLGALCWFFRDVIVYILIAGVISLIGKPLMDLLGRMNIKGHRLPSWIAAIIGIIIIIGGLLAVMTLVIPVIVNIAKDISMVNVGSAVKSVSIPLADINMFLIEKFPNLGTEFRIEKVILEQTQKLLNMSTVSSAISSVTSFISSFGVGLFSVVFISFFFLKDDRLFSKIVAALIPDRHEQEADAAFMDIRRLLTRYFLGLVVEVSGVALLNFLGLMFVAKLGFNAAISIAFITGLMNIIPYVGPLTGGFIGTVLGLVLKFVCGTHLGLDIGFWGFALILIGIFSVTQLVDNFLFQPIIYSNSIKASPLEVFIILLMAGHIGGILGMLVAIPSYTVIRVVAGRFFRKFKFIRRLIPDPQENKEKDPASSAG